MVFTSYSGLPWVGQSYLRKGCASKQCLKDACFQFFVLRLPFHRGLSGVPEALIQLLKLVTSDGIKISDHTGLASFLYKRLQLYACGLRDLCGLHCGMIHAVMTEQRE